MGGDIRWWWRARAGHEKVYTRWGLEFGNWAIITKALYGLKTSAFTWLDELGGMLHHDLAFQQCKADNDVWMRPSMIPDGMRYYEMVFV